VSNVAHRPLVIVYGHISESMGAENFLYLLKYENVLKAKRILLRILKVL
jgi:hypothetical protein